MRSLVRTSIILGVIGAASTARGQAWVGEEQSLEVTAGYTIGISQNIVESNGSVLNNRPVTYQTMLVGGEYTTPIPHLALDLSLIFVATSYSCQKTTPNVANSCIGTPGGSMNGGHGPWDDGSLHLTPTDLRIGGRYQLIGDPIALTVGLAGTIPTHDYPVQGFAAPGRDLKGVHANLSIGWIPGFLPRLHATLMYEFSYFQKYDAPVCTSMPPSGPNDPTVPNCIYDGSKTTQFGQNRSDVQVRVGYFLLEPWELHLAADIRIQHDGVDFINFDSYSRGIQDFHDPVLRETLYLIGLGTSYQITDDLQVAALFRYFLHGTNTRDPIIFGGGLSYKIF